MTRVRVGVFPYPQGVHFVDLRHFVWFADFANILFVVISVGLVFPLGGDDCSYSWLEHGSLASSGVWLGQRQCSCGHFSVATNYRVRLPQLLQQGFRFLAKIPSLVEIDS
jgi:hypothetical protein